MLLSEARTKLTNSLNKAHGNRFYKINNIIDRVYTGARYSDCKEDDQIEGKLSDELVIAVKIYSK